MLSCVPFSLFAWENYIRGCGCSLSLRGNVSIGHYILLREICIRLVCSPWLRRIVTTGLSLLWREMCIRVSLLLIMVTRFFLWLRVATGANGSKRARLPPFCEEVWVESAACLAALSVRLRVCLDRQTNTALTCHNGDESKYLVVVNRGSYRTWNCELTRPESRFITNATSWFCKGDLPKYTPTLDLVFHLWWIFWEEWRASLRKQVGQPKGCQCFGFSWTWIHMKSWRGDNPWGCAKNGVSL